MVSPNRLNKCKILNKRAKLTKVNLQLKLRPNRNGCKVQDFEKFDLQKYLIPDHKPSQLVMYSSVGDKEES